MRMRHVLKSRKGLTLVEVVVSLAILSILAVFILSVFASSLNIIAGNANLKKGNHNAAAGIENKFAGFDADANLSVINQQSGSIQIEFGGVSIEAAGKFITGNDIKNDSEYYAFIPD